MSNKTKPKATMKRLEGKTIARVETRPFETGNAGTGARSADGKWTTDPRIVFTDGSSISFCVAETEAAGAYGVEINYKPKP